MSPPPLLLLLLLLLFLFLSSGHLPLALSADVAVLSGCNRTFSCGSIRNITYPFTGGDRPEYCGLPEFRISCRDGYAELSMSQLVYRVLRINQTGYNLTLARLDLWNNICPSKFVNSTLNFEVFDYGAGNEDLNLFYGCDRAELDSPRNPFNCSEGGHSNYSYYLTGPVPSDPILKLIHCNISLWTPVLKSEANKLTANETTLGEVLTAGFNVNYIDPYGADCSKCIARGGQCGYDYDNGEPICICSDRICHGHGRGKNRNTGKIVGLVVLGAALVAISFGGLFYFLVQRRRRASNYKTKDIPTPTPPSSKGIAPSLTTFSGSIPSYPYIRSDIEKGSTYFGVQVFDYMELEKATNNFDPSRKLGDGGFGTVYYGELEDGRVVAVKRLYENNFRRVEQFMNEIEILTRLHHQNLVKLYGCTSRRSQELLLVYEYIPNGTVGDHLHGRRANSGLLNWSVRLGIAIETADALAFLHESDTIHRDVKTNNILLDNNFRVKVADFGLSRLFPTNVTHVSTAPQGTPGYVDPEYHQCYHLTDKSDVYSFGVVLVELISSKQAVDITRHRHDINLANMAVNKIQNHSLHELVDLSLGFESNCATRRMITLVAELAFRCLQQERDMRPTMEEVLKALRRIKNEENNMPKAEVVDIDSEGAGLLKD